MTCHRKLPPYSITTKILLAGALMAPLANASEVPATLAGRGFLTLPGSQWKLAWNDEFNGSELDKAKWSIGLPWSGDDGEGRHHNDQYLSYIMDDDVRVSGGALHLTTQRRQVKSAKGKTYDYTEGLITTSGKYRTTYGYLEMRALLPTQAGPGVWPAFWTLSDGWPPEFDILEYWGSDTRIHQGTVTRKADGGQRWDSYHRKQVSLEGWHTYGLEWGPGYQIYNIDGVPTNVIYGDHIPEVGHYILLNSGIEAQRPPRPGTVFPNDFMVDWVRVYARPEVPTLLNADFEQDSLAPWTRFGEASIVNYGGRGRALRADSSAPKAGEKAERSGVQQVIYGLKQNSRYRVFVRARPEGKATAVLGVKDAAGGEQVRSAATSGVLALTFSTDEKAKSATVFLASEGEGTVFFDDVSVEAVK